MTLDELRKYKNLQRSIRYWKKELAILKSASYTKSPQMTGMPGAGKLPDPTAERALKEEKVMARLELMVAEQQREADRIMEWILSIEDPMIQTLMHARYIKDRSWTAVAHILGGYNTAESVRQMHSRYLSHLSQDSRLK